MDRVLPDALLRRYSEFLAARMGLHFPQERWRDLERGTRHATNDLGFDDMQACVEQLLSRPISRTEVEILASHLTVGETYFFRDRASFDALESRVLPEMIRARRSGARRLRIWSAGCCTGEEAYSIAILLARLIPDLSTWNIAILGTDINPRFLNKAVRGVYKDWSFRDAPAGVKDGFFTRTGEGFEIGPRIKALVTFACHNLAEDAYPSVDTGTNAMDIIFCRNVLMYFEPARGKHVLGHLASCLIEGGWLFVSSVEAPQVLLPRIVEVKFPGVVAYRKDSTSVRAERRSAPIISPVTNSSTRTFSISGSPRTDPDTAGRSIAPAPGMHPQQASDSSKAKAEVRACAEVEAREAAHQECDELYQQGRYAEVAEWLREVLETSPTDVRAMALLARTCANQGLLVEAVQWCNRAAEADKLNPQWHYLLATILQEQGGFDAAVAALKRALYLDPNHTMAHFALGNLARKQGKSKECERHFRNAQAALKRYPPQQVLPESEGITAGRLAEIITSAGEVWR